MRPHTIALLALALLLASPSAAVAVKRPRAVAIAPADRPLSDDECGVCGGDGSTCATHCHDDPYLHGFCITVRWEINNNSGTCDQCYDTDDYDDCLDGIDTAEFGSSQSLNQYCD